MSAAAGLDPALVQTSMNTNSTKRHAQNVRKKIPMADADPAREDKTMFAFFERLREF